MIPELYYLVATALLTAVIWIPYALNCIIVGGLMNATGPHANAVENL